MDFPGVALVTGAGIGRETAILYAKEGCKRISISDISADGLQKTRHIIESRYEGVSVRATKTDVSDEDAVQALLDGTIEQIEMTTGFFDKHHEVNLRGLFFCERAELQYMLKQDPLPSKDSKYAYRGSIVNVSSMTGITGNKAVPAYTASKHGVVGLSRADGMFYGQHGIRVNTVCPGTVATPILASSGNSSTQAPLEDSTTLDINALQRFGDPEELAQGIVWLTSGRASYVTAAVLVMNGGMIGR